jgi:aconitate hydratase
VIAKDFARIHWQNLIDFGILPLTFKDPADYDRLDSGDTLKFSGIPDQLRRGKRITFQDITKQRRIETLHDLSVRQINVLLSGGLINWFKLRVTEQAIRH